jgi:hypothetical protein
MKTILSNIDYETIETFKIKYPGWTIVRYSDNSMKYKPPIPQPLIKKEVRTIWKTLE